MVARLLATSGLAKKVEYNIDVRPSGSFSKIPRLARQPWRNSSKSWARGREAKALEARWKSTHRQKVRRRVVSVMDLDAGHISKTLPEKHVRSSIDTKRSSV